MNEPYLSVSNYTMTLAAISFSSRMLWKIPKASFIHQSIKNSVVYLDFNSVLSSWDKITLEKFIWNSDSYTNKDFFMSLFSYSWRELNYIYYVKGTYINSITASKHWIVVLKTTEIFFVLFKHLT